MGFSLVVHGVIPKDEIMGVVIGHVWYFFCDVYPPLHNGSKPFDPPAWWRRLFDRPAQQVIDSEGVLHVRVGGGAAAAPEVR